MINYDTIKSVYEDKLTLMQWLVKVQKALKDATAVSFDVNKRGDATLTFSISFDDGTELETDPIILEQGESVQSATLRNGHLILTLTNGDELDAGNMGAVSGFFINGAQHLIVQYQDGTTNDLGAIFNGSISINGNISATGNISASGNISGKIPVLTTDEDEITAQKPVVEVMTGYSVSHTDKANLTITRLFESMCKNGNKLTLVSFMRLQRTGEVQYDFISGCTKFLIPYAVGEKLEGYGFSGPGNYLVNGKVSAFKAYNSSIDLYMDLVKASNTSIELELYGLNSLDLNTDYILRVEATFLISENLAE